MKITAIIKVLFCAILFATVAACDVSEEMERNTPPAYSPDVEMCQVHLTFDYSLYEGEGYIADTVFIRNGQASSVKVLLTYADDEIVALERTISRLHEGDYDTFIPKGSDIWLRIKFQDVNNDWVDCSDPVFIHL